MTDEFKSTGDTPSRKRRKGARWGQERRLEFIDYRLKWDGQINRSNLIDFFGISVPQASLDLTEYTKLAPDNLEYDASTRVYRSTRYFLSVFTTSSLERYLDDILRAAIQPGVPYESFLGWHSPVAAVPRLLRRLNTDVVGEILRAIRESGSVYVAYQSMSDPEGCERKITPHALVHDGYRWHTRAYCHKRKEFRNFLLSRIVHAKNAGEAQERSNMDTAWNTMVEVIIIAHPALSPAQRRLIESDYAMDNGEVHLECRKALLYYLLFQLNLTDAQAAQKPQALLVSLKNRDDIYTLIQQ